jgi:hypothetical protein
LLVATLAPGPVALAHELAATDTFVGTATTGLGQPQPILINPTDLKVRADGAIGLGYVYRAVGVAVGEMPGQFDYIEHGYMYFTNPADPTTFVGSALAGALFTLEPRRAGAPIRIADTSPASYASGTAVMPAPNLGGRAGRTLAASVGRAPAGRDLTYGYFTFTDDHGTFTGYATPDFRRFAITITFDLPQPGR